MTSRTRRRLSGRGWKLSGKQIAAKEHEQLEQIVMDLKEFM